MSSRGQPLTRSGSQTSWRSKALCLLAVVSGYWSRASLASDLHSRPPNDAARVDACVRLRAAIYRVRTKCSSGHDVTAAEIDAGGGEGAVRLLGGGGGRDGGPGLK